MKCLLTGTAFLAVLSSSSVSVASTPAPQGSIDCVVSGSACGTSIDTADTSNYSLVSVAGYHNPLDGGGGVYRVVGKIATQCPSATSVMGTVNNTNPYELDSVSSATSFQVGSILTSPGLPIYTQILRTGTGKLILTAPATVPGGTVVTFNVTGKNDGTLLNDGNNNCLTKVNYRGEPHEWGAYGIGGNVDSVPLQKWLAGPGPWDAVIPATYVTNVPLTCWPNIHIRAISNDSHIGAYTPMPLVTIKAGSGFPTMSQVPVIMAENYCHITGLAVDAGDTGQTNTLVDAVDIDSVGDSAGVVIDGHALLENGNYNLFCNSNKGSPGLQIKDVQFGPSWSDNIFIGSCANSRFIGDLIAKAGLNSVGSGTTWMSGHPAGFYFTGDDMTLMGGVIEESVGAGLVLNTANKVSVGGMFIDGSGAWTGSSALDDPGILIVGQSAKKSADVSICNNHLYRNDGAVVSSSPASSGAQIRFDGPVTDVSFCGNVYSSGVQGGGATVAVPLFVYDATSSAAVPKTTIYENPRLQESTSNVFSPGAVAANLQTKQVCPSGAAGPCP